MRSLISHTTLPLLLLEIILNLSSAINNPAYFYEAILVKSHLSHFRMWATSVHLSVLISPILFTQLALENLARAAFGQRLTRNSTLRGTLYPAISVRAWAINSSSVTLIPGLQTTTACTDSPQFSAGMPMTAASSTAGWV